MKAVLLRDGQLTVAEVPTPRPQAGQVLLNVSRAGICGSDVHMRTGIAGSADTAAAVGYKMAGEGTGVVLGHEFVGEVAEYGSGTLRRWKPGTPVVSLPVLRNGRDPEVIGVSERASGGYAEQMLVQESISFRVPNGLSAEHAALTEPMAVGWHAVRRSRIQRRQTAYVIGCGPVGLAVIAGLKAAGVHAVVASDLSPRRRELAAIARADVVVDPKIEEPFAAAPAARPSALDRLRTIPKSPWWITSTTDNAGDGFKTMEALRKLPITPWWHVFRAMYALERGPLGPVIFDCVGAPGLIDRLMADAPMMSRLVLIGACNGHDSIRPKLGIYKEAEIRFATGYDAGEFRDVLHMIADGKINVEPFITGTVGLGGVTAAFDALDDPEQHAKILIDPQSPVTTV